MTQTIETPTSVDELKILIKKLNSKAGQMKMELHDIAEGLPTDLDRLLGVASETHAIFTQIAALKKQLAQLEKG